MSDPKRQRLRLLLRNRWILAILGAVLLLLARQTVGFAQLPDTIGDVEAIARSTTVLIGPDLERESFEAGEVAETSGSGVIIAKQRQKYAVPNSAGLTRGTSLAYEYYVLTNAHVVADQTLYGVRMSDGDFVRVDDTEEALERGMPQILRLGRDIRNSFEGTDLAILRFVSDRDYPVASLADPQSIQEEESVLVSGWPVPQVTGFQRRSRIPIYGEVLGIDPDGTRTGGYDLRLTAFAETNMSGGPVYNSRGQVIGIYGRRGTVQDGAGLAVPVGKLLLPAVQQRYAAFYEEPPHLRASAVIDQRAIALGKTDVLKADNLTAAEFAQGFGSFDVLRTDPNYQAIQNMKTQYDCMQSFGDGTFRPSKFESRGEMVADLNSCLDRISDVFAAETAAKLVQKDDLQTMKQLLLELAADIVALRG